ncbi:MAG TPA: TRAP transporter large permease subunit [Polyangiaceae bacterium]|nr:TRAP transporter large permease subunit [Polyangiaceae bacterium]
MAGAAPTAKPAAFLRPLDIVDRGILLAETTLCLVVVGIMVLFAVAASAAELFGIQNVWLQSASDVLLHGTIWAAFLGASFATRERRHLAIDAFGRLLPDRVRRAVVATAATFGAIVAFALASGIYQALLDQVAKVHEDALHLQASGITGVIDKSFEFQFVIPAGFVLIGARLLLHAFHEWLAAIAGTNEPEPIPHALDPEVERVAPVSEASPIEIGIALAALVVLLVLAWGSSVMGPVSVGVVLAAVALTVPLVLRKRRGGSYAAPVVVATRHAVGAGAREIALALAAVVVVIVGSWAAIEKIPSIPIAWGVAFFAVMALMGAPLFSFLGGLALFLWTHGSETVPAMSLPNAVEDVLGPHFARMSVLPTIPVFTLAGYLMSESKTPQRMVRVARAFLGFAPGGLGIVCVLASAFFTIFSGASGITIVAIGGLLLPALLKDRYPEKFSLGLVTTGGALGITFPPCLPLIVYGIVAGLQEMPPGKERLALDKFLLAGIRPGLLLIGLLVVYCIIVGIRSKLPRSRFDAKEARAALWEAKWELFLPFFLLGGLVTGVFSPITAAAFTAFYVLVIEVFLYKDLSLTRDLPRIVPDSMVLVGAIFVKLCAATVLTFYFVQSQTADRLFEALTCGPPAQEYLAAHSDSLATCREAVDALARHGKSAGGIIDSPLTFLLALNVFLLIVGMLMDIFSAIVVVVPLIMGIALHFDINPYHLGIVFLLNLEIGYLMPPMGLNLFIAGFRFNRPVPDLYRVVLPFIGIFVVALLVTTYVPSLTVGSAAAETAHPPPSGAPPPPAASASVAVPAASAAPSASPPDCDEQRENESFDDFDKRCNITGAHPAPSASAVPSASAAPPASAAPSGGDADCEEPRANESFDAFDKRCGITGTKP